MLDDRVADQVYVTTNYIDQGHDVEGNHNKA
jgi:hypothetical protein